MIPSRVLAAAYGCGLLLSVGCGSGGGGGGGSTSPQQTTAPVTTQSSTPAPNPYTPAPTSPTQSGSVFVSTFSPASGHPAGGELLVITGMGFDDTSQVRIGGFNARVLIRTQTELVVATPQGSGSATLRVSNGPQDYAESTAGYVYVAPSNADGFHFQADTDKWWINVDYSPGADADSNGFSDLSDALQVAKNNLGSAGFPGQYDQAAAYLFSYLSQMYRNNPDGSRSTGGALVSFQRVAPGFGQTPATPGRPESVGTLIDFNHLAVRNVGYISPGYEQNGTTGRASSESRQNVTLENNSAISDLSGNPLGAYADSLIYWWNQSSVPTSRRTLETLMKEFAALVAHEAGHSLGLTHLADAPLAPATDNIMAATTVIGTGSNVYAFDEPTWRAMLSWLPGTTRQVHRAAWSPRRLLADSDVVVLGTPVRLQNGTLELQVDRVLAGDMGTGFARVGGFDGDVVVGKSDMADTGPTLMFLKAGQAGLEVDLGQASAMPLAGRDSAEWAALIADYQALAGLSGAAWQARCAEILTGCLDSNDARIRVDALVDLSTELAVARGLTTAQTTQIVDLLQNAESAFERCLAAQVLGHAADRARADTLVAAGLGEDHPAVLADVAGALEQTLGLAGAAARVRTRLIDLDAAGRARAATLLGWLQDGQSLALIAADLRGADAARACRAADALGAMQAQGALTPLQTLAQDGQADLVCRLHALRAIGQIGGADAQAWLTEAAQSLESDTLREGARFARDFASSWTIR